MTDRTTALTLLSCGSVMCRNCWRRFAPSTLAASYSAGSMPLRPAEIEHHDVTDLAPQCGHDHRVEGGVLVGEPGVPPAPEADGRQHIVDQAVRLVHGLPHQRGGDQREDHRQEQRRPVEPDAAPLLLEQQRGTESEGGGQTAEEHQPQHRVQGGRAEDRIVHHLAEVAESDEGRRRKAVPRGEREVEALHGGPEDPEGLGEQRQEDEGQDHRGHPRGPGPPCGADQRHVH